MDVRTASDQYVFESENASDNPVSVILRGHLPGEDTDLYYRVMLIDDEGEQVLIRRNCHYRLNIAGRAFLRTARLRQRAGGARHEQRLGLHIRRGE